MKSEDGQKERVVHHNLLTQCIFLPVEKISPEEPRHVQLPTMERDALDMAESEVNNEVDMLS